MLPTLRNAIIRQFLISAAICFGLSLALTFASSGTLLGLAQLGVPVILSLGIGAVTAWLTMTRFKKNIVNAIVTDMSYARVDRAAHTDFDWKTIDEYAEQLQSRGFTPLGDYTVYPAPVHTIGVAACFVNADASVLVEVQHMMLTRATVATPAGFSTVHFSVFSVLAGQAPVVATDRPVSAANYMQRGDYSVLGSYPGESLMGLLDKHERLVATMRERSGKSASNGLTMTRYLILLRERMGQARSRLQATGAYTLVQQFDAYGADPKSSWAPEGKALADMASRSWADIDASPASLGRPPVIETPDAAAITAGAEPGAAEDGVRAAMLRQRIDSSANWFYWIAGLSAVNMFISAVGSNWSFVIGIGATQFLSAVIRAAAAEANPPVIGIGILWLLNLGLAGFFAACGWFARRPSTVAFVAGMVLFGLDTIIFLLIADWIGVIFHAIALYSLWPGLVAGRELKRLSA